MICILIRHGKTAGNEVGAYIGRKSDEVLSTVGREQARKCDYYDFVSNCRIYASPLKRAFETAQLLFDEDITVIEEIAEMDFGEFEGKSYDSLKDDCRYQSWIDSGGEDPFPGGESRQEFVDRTMVGFNRILRMTGEEETAVIVGHGGTVMAIMSSLTGGNYYDFQVKNLEGYRIEFRTDGERISDISYNRISCGNNT